MDSELLHYKLVKPGILREIIFLDEVNSTNEYAASGKFGSDTLIVAKNQTGGKGRFGREWISSPGKNVAITLVKSFSLRIDEIHNAGFYSSLIVLNAFRKFLPEYSAEFSLKWPNDILFRNKKVAGLLLDSRDLRNPEKLIAIGAGININEDKLSPELIHKATSLLIETGREFSPEKFIIILLDDFYDRFELVYDTRRLMEEWRKNCCHLGKEIGFRQLSDGEVRTAKVKDINDDGSLRLILDNGTEKSFYSGEISLSPSYSQSSGF